MAKKDIDELKKVIGTDKAIIGTDRTMKALKTGKLAKVYEAKNISQKVKQDIEYYSEHSKTKIVETELTNEELGVICKKTFSISLLGVTK